MGISFPSKLIAPFSKQWQIPSTNEFVFVMSLLGIILWLGISMLVCLVHQFLTTNASKRANKRSLDNSPWATLLEPSFRLGKTSQCVSFWSLFQSLILIIAWIPTASRTLWYEVLVGGVQNPVHFLAEHTMLSAGNSHKLGKTFPVNAAASFSRCSLAKGCYKMLRMSLHTGFLSRDHELSNWCIHIWKTI